MSLIIPCSLCGSKLPGKLANVTVAWYTAAQDRVAYRLKLCSACYMMQILPLSPDPESQALVCPVCHTDSESDMDPVYITSYVPDVGKIQMELPTDGPCAAKIRIPVVDHGVKLESQFGGQGPGPQTTATSASDWAKLGLYPAE
jgi:hypothetical protein